MLCFMLLFQMLYGSIDDARLLLLQMNCLRHVRSSSWVRETEETVLQQHASNVSLSSQLPSAHMPAMTAT